MTTTASVEENEGVSAVQERPEQVDDGIGATDYGERNEDLPEQLQNALKTCVQECQKQEMYDRRREVLVDRRNRFYERGFQHVYANGTGSYTQGSPGAQIANDGRTIQCPQYIDDYNVFAPCLEILQAIMTQNDPGIDFRADNPNRSEDIEASETAEGYRQLFDRKNDVKSIMRNTVRMFGNSGRTIMWVRSEANAQKWGLDPDGNAKTGEVATVYGTLESKVPITAKSMDDWLYAILTDDPDIKIAKTEYPKFKDKIKVGMASLGENAYERIARLGILQGTRTQAQIGDSMTHLCTRAHVWLRPAAFTGEKYDDALETPEPGDTGEDGSVMTVQDKLKDLFPSGCHCVFVGDEYVGSWDESMDDALVVGFPYEGDGMFRPAMMSRAITFQDRFNDDRNAYAEVKDKGWPSTYVDASEVEWDSFTDQRADPFALRLKKSAGAQMAVADAFYREPDPEIPETFVNDTEALLQLLYFVLGTPPALFGEAEADQKTASGFAQMRSQAMGRLGLPYGALQGMMARMYYLAALCAAKNPDHSEEIVVAGGDGTNIAVHLEKLTKGKFGSYPDEDSSFPESTSAKRQQLMSIVTLAAQSPVGMQLFNSPDNWEVFKELLGFPELTLVQAEARNKQLREIEILIQTSPIPPDPQMVMQAQVDHAADTIAAGPMGQPEPSPLNTAILSDPTVAVEPLDYHEFELEKCKEWLSSEACWREKANGNFAGIQNVILHAAQHQQFIAQAAMAAAAAAAPPQMPAGGPPRGKPAGPPKPQGEPGAPNGISAPPGAPGGATM